MACNSVIFLRILVITYGAGNADITKLGLKRKIHYFQYFQQNFLTNIDELLSCLDKALCIDENYFWLRSMSITLP